MMLKTDEINPRHPIKFATLLCVFVLQGAAVDLDDTEPSPSDGWFNNLVHPEWGAIDGQLIRRSPPAYSDGVYEPGGIGRPNPLDISTAAHSGQAGLGSARGRNALLVFFGQQLVEEVLDSQRPGCPFEYHNIHVPAGHPRFDASYKGNIELPVLRTRYDSRTGYSPNNPRQQLNEITPYIDGTLFYGPGKAWTDSIREFKGGRLKVDDTSKHITEQFPAANNIRLPFANPPPPRDHYLKSVTRFFRIGNLRGFENPFQLTFAVIWFRWHNHVADQLAAQHPDWDDEKLFNNAKKRVIAHHQKISMYDWLPRWLSIDEHNNFFEIPPYYRNNSDTYNNHPFNGYDPEVHPGISQEFQTAAMRFGHTLVPPGIWLRGPKNGTDCKWKMLQATISGQQRTVSALRLCNTYWNGQETVEPMMEDLIRGMSSTLSEREDPIVVPDLREHVFGTLDFSRRDLPALNILRARDHGVADYNTVRDAYKLPKLTNWNEINSDPNIQNGAISRLKALYDNRNSSIDDIDLFPGGLLETTLNGPGPLFQRILLDQFLRIRHGDRFWFENTEDRYRQFTDAEIESILQLTMKDIITNVTNIDPDDLPSDVFLHNNATDPCSQPLQIAADTYQLNNGYLVTENCTSVQHYDYFYGSTVPYITTFSTLALCVPGTYVIMMFMGYLRRRSMFTRRKHKIFKSSHSKVSPQQIVVRSSEFEASEWMGSNAGSRLVLVLFDKDKQRISIKDPLDNVLRVYDVMKQEEIEIFTTGQIRKKSQVMCIRIKGYIDLVLKFDDEREMSNSLAVVTSFLSDVHLQYKLHDDQSEKAIFKMARTKAEREKELNDFLKMFTAKIFDGKLAQFPTDQLTSYHLDLTKFEFAEILGLRPGSDFISHMFDTVDRDGNGFISLKEFMDFFFIMSEGDANQKALLIFNMYDSGNKEHLTREDFSDMIMSLMDLSDSRTVLSKEDLTLLVGTVYENVGLNENEGMDFSVFKRVFLNQDYVLTMKDASIPIKAVGRDEQKDTETDDLVLKTEDTFFGDKLSRQSSPGSPADNPSPVQTRGSTHSAESSITAFQRSRTMIQERLRESPPATPPERRKTNLTINPEEKHSHPSIISQYLFNLKYSVEKNRLQIFWITLYSLVTAGIFIERAVYYSLEREHGGLRRIAGYGVSVTRGAASVMMFTFSSLMVTMSKNTITYFRETTLHRFIPFDSAHFFHKYIASIALLFTVIHCIGHGFNFYHICTQPAPDLGCLFREYARFSDVLPTFNYWAFGTITGMSGIILVIIVIVMIVFALPYGRRYLFNVFTFTHKFYIPLYIFLFLHGSGRLVQKPLFHFFFIGPALLFIADKFVSLKRQKREIKLIGIELLPSDVLSLTFQRPADFHYTSGQWVQIACQGLGSSEYHPFTLTSAPYEHSLSLHIRAVGPWTTNLREMFDKSNTKAKVDLKPKMYLDGPFGEGHQDWYKYPVSVLVGGGIGVTPFASILKDVVYRASRRTKSMNCKKIYFLWVTRTQKQFEWFTDIIREVEKNDKKNLVDVHIFITQFKDKYDLRTTMLYICERHFQKLAGKSLLTGLEAKTHFGRPRFHDFFRSLTKEHPQESKIGVFSCGPLPMSLSVEKACTDVAKEQQRTAFKHHHENF